MKPAVPTRLPREPIMDVLNGIPHGIALLDEGLRIVAMNRMLEIITGYDAEAVRGVAADYVLRCHFLERGEVFQAALAGGDMRTVEGDIINASRKKIAVRCTVSPVMIEAGLAARVMVMLEDISLLRAIEQHRPGHDEAKGMLGHSPKMREIFELLPVLSHTDATVLITGETGTGKDLLAEAVHHASKRAKYPFIKVNCGALPEALLESELFGHVRGAFTGAHADKPGLFRLAQGGTIFLTEIGDLPLPLQVKLLTVLDDKAFFPLGSAKKVTVDTRIITGTHRDLRQLVQEGRFREDLFFRLNVLRAHLPPLREREGDVRLLMDHFLHQFVNSLGKNIKDFSREAVTLLTRYSYPGNVRELRNIVEYATNICQGERIEPEHLPASMQEECMHEIDRQAGKAAGSVMATESDRIGQAAAQPAASSWTEIEKKYILQALMKTGGNRTRAAKELGWGRSTLWRKITLYGLD